MQSKVFAAGIARSSLMLVLMGYKLKLAPAEKSLHLFSTLSITLVIFPIWIKKRTFFMEVGSYSEAFALRDLLVSPTLT